MRAASAAVKVVWSTNAASYRWLVLALPIHTAVVRSLNNLICRLLVYYTNVRTWGTQVAGNVLKLTVPLTITLYQ